MVPELRSRLAYLSLRTPRTTQRNAVKKTKIIIIILRIRGGRRGR